ncbi:MAG: hypothetical protein Q8K53_00750 [Daejeonella sp.]|nr:hypothetical protein [Daejeonella sp.]
MIRTVLKPKHQDVTISLPKNFIGKQVEILAFTIDEAQETDIAAEPLTHYASEKVLSESWLTPEEDEAWKSL